MTTSYAVFLKPRAERDLDRLPVAVARRIWQRLVTLEADPRPPAVTKLEGSDAYRLRIGDYRQSIWWTIASGRSRSFG